MQYHVDKTTMQINNYDSNWYDNEDVDDETMMSSNTTMLGCVSTFGNNNDIIYYRSVYKYYAIKMR